MNVNIWVGAGNLTRDIEIKYIPSGKAVANLDMAINRTWMQDDEKKSDVCYVRCVVWGNQAESASKYLKKGSGVLVEGRLQSRSWETDDGQKRSTMEVVANRVQFMDKKDDKPVGKNEPEPANDEPGPDKQSEIPF